MIRVRHLFIVILTPSFLSLSQDTFNGVYDVSFSVGYFVTFGGLKAKDGECSKCSGPFGVLITLEIECKPKKAEYSCNGLKNSWENDDCVKYCGRRFGMYIARIYLHSHLHLFPSIPFSRRFLQRPI